MSLGAAQCPLGTGLRSATRAISVLNGAAIPQAFYFTFNLQVLLKSQKSGKII